MILEMNIKWYFNPIALRTAKTPSSFGHSERDWVNTVSVSFSHNRAVTSHTNCLT